MVVVDVERRVWRPCVPLPLPPHHHLRLLLRPPLRVLCPPAPPTASCWRHHPLSASTRFDGPHAAVCLSVLIFKSVCLYSNPNPNPNALHKNPFCALAYIQRRAHLRIPTDGSEKIPLHLAALTELAQ